ncbi:hypothetical protein, partial [Propionivibrio sp.]|uniref:hypothetical protein n=1 Tax=Propionivibrio sp. TaxID=2212460 RepID=UPI00272EE84E
TKPNPTSSPATIFVAFICLPSLKMPAPALQTTSPKSLKPAMNSLENFFFGRPIIQWSGL